MPDSIIYNMFISQCIYTVCSLITWILGIHDVLFSAKYLCKLKICIIDIMDTGKHQTPRKKSALAQCP